MSTKTANLVITQGRDYSQVVSFFNAVNEPFDITGYSFNAQLRKINDQHSTFLAEFTITPDIANSKLTMRLNKSDTKDLTPGTVWWDLVATNSGGYSQSWLSGQVVVKGGPTEV